MEDLKTLYNFYLEQKEKPRDTKIKEDNFKFLELALLRSAIDKLLKDMEV